MRATLQVAATLLTALALAPGLAHAFELPAKIHMSEADYFTVQRIYRGWALLGGVLLLALIADAAFAFSLRGEGAAFALATAGTVVLAATLAIFFAFTQPANAATRNWSVATADWATLRVRWEYSHAVNAGLTFLALVLIVLAGVRRS
jgi:hypothetical protein